MTKDTLVFHLNDSIVRVPQKSPGVWRLEKREGQATFWCEVHRTRDGSKYCASVYVKVEEGAVESTYIDFIAQRALSLAARSIVPPLLLRILRELKGLT